LGAGVYCIRSASIRHRFMAGSERERDSTERERLRLDVVLRALREASGVSQDGWAAHLGYGRATVQRWETGEALPRANAREALVALCREKGLFRTFDRGPLRGVTLTPEALRDLFAGAQVESSDAAATEAQSFTVPTTRYALNGDVAIAYQVFGSGPIDLVVSPGLVSHVEFLWEHPGAVRFFRRLAGFARVIIFDKRGTGLSDRTPVATLDDRIDDLRAVMDAAGSERAALLGISEGGPYSILFAATYPERTAALLLYGTFTRYSIDDHPLGNSPEQLRAFVDRLRETWGMPDRRFLRWYAPSVADDPQQVDWWAKHNRLSASPGAVMAIMLMQPEIDVWAVLPTIQMPVLVLHRTGDRAVGIAYGREMAAQIAGATFVELPGPDHLSWVGDVEAIADEIEDFLTGVQRVRAVDRVLVTVLVIDFAGSTEAAGGGRRPRERYHALVQRELTRHRGREVETAGNRVTATFDGPTRAVRCGLAIRDAAREFGLEIRAGLHAGEVEIHENGGVTGLTLQIAARVAAKAEEGEVLVSGTVKDLVAGALSTFVDRGPHALTGVPGEWRLFAAQQLQDTAVRDALILR
jgi:pimeloyl-ACP methyl ester carboxylesterase/DNA-binding transcriptional regulator YiaG